VTNCATACATGILTNISVVKKEKISLLKVDLDNLSIRKGNIVIFYI